MSTILNIENLSVNYGKTNILKNISFAVEKGDFIGLAGPNGAGKTTLIKAILGLLPILKGKIELFKESTNKFNDWNNW